MMRGVLLWVAGGVACWSGMTLGQRVAEPPTVVVAADEAGRHVGKECVVEMVVAASRLLTDKEMCFLNSHADHRDSDNFTAVIFRDALARFAADGIKDPAAHFRDKKIRVRGRIEEHQGRPQIKVEQPGQIEVVEEDQDR
jgi:DNA/RNA endonuclease YhcR with UshA esterase domain